MSNMKMISNSDGAHLDELKKLFQSQSDKTIIISPFLAKNIQDLLSDKGTTYSMILGSANFTRNGLSNNHEWSVQIADDIVIENIVEDTFSSIEYPEVTYHQICKVCLFAE